MTTYTDVACPGCGCACDDLAVTFDNGRLIRVEGGCSQAQAWFTALNDPPPAVALADGSPTELEDAVAIAAKILRESRSPLLYGLASSSTPGQRAAIRLAERLGAVIDPAASLSQGPAIRAMQEVGESTCTLGDVRDRADFVVFWGVDPMTTHPRHLERFSANPASDLLPQGRRDRTIFVVDTQPTATAKQADHFLPLDDSKELETLNSLRRLIRPTTGHNGACAGSEQDPWKSLAAAMTSCRYGVLFYDPAAAGESLRHLVIEQLFRLVAEINAHTRFCAVSLGSQGGSGGAETVLCWQTGFPFAVDFSRGFPRYNPDEYSADRLLSRQDVDTCLIVGSDSVARLSSPAREFLGQIPTIVLDPCTTSPSFPSSLRIATAIYGVHATGTLYRSDGVALPLRALQPTSFPTDESVLNQFYDAL